MAYALTRLTTAGLLLAALVVPSAPARAEDAQRAKELFRQGSVYFDLGQYDRAIEVWQKGYEQKQDPGFLYNIAQAHRLSGNANKAILFYKSFLRNSPKAENRAEIEQRITALQSQVAGGDTGQSKPQAEGAAAAAAATPTSSPPEAGASAEPPARDTLPGRFPPARRTEVVVTSSAAPPQTAASNQFFDVGVALGGNVWMSGVQGSSTPSSFSGSLSMGYTFPTQLAGRVRFRLGALGGFTFLNDTSGTASFFSALLDPGVQIRLTNERLFLNADVGVGVLALAGLKADSALLTKDQPLAVSGTQSLFELRPGLAMEYRIRPNLAARVGSSLSYTPRRTYFHGSIVRLDFHAGFGFLF